jgi:hypothetical protein
MIFNHLLNDHGAEVSALCFLSFLFLALINDGRS